MLAPVPILEMGHATQAKNVQIRVEVALGAVQMVSVFVAHF